MKLDWLAPAFDQAKTPFTVPDSWTTKVSVTMGAYILFVIYPAYIALRYFWAGHEPTFQSFVTALATAVFFVLFARRTMTRYFTVRGQNIEPKERL